jgi:membrane carboxypeptidase/penicillin-binding protein
VGFTPDLLAVVWVGYDNNQSLGLSGAQAALPIWTRFMKAATAGLPVADFSVPQGITFATIDPQSALLARSGCPEREAQPFLQGTEPRATCNLH